MSGFTKARTPRTVRQPPQNRVNGCATRPCSFLTALRQAHAVRLPLGDVQQPGVGLAHRRVVRDAREHHAVRHLGPVDLEAVAQVPRAARATRPMSTPSRSLMSLKPAHVPGVVGRGLDEVELLQAEFLQARHHAFVELRVGAHAPVLLGRSRRS